MPFFEIAYIWIIFSFSFLDIRQSCSSSLLVSLVFGLLIETWNRVVFFDILVYFVPFFGVLFFFFFFFVFPLFLVFAFSLAWDCEEKWFREWCHWFQRVCCEILAWGGLVQQCHFDCYLGYINSKVIFYYHL